ncbi:hypothetical protein FHS78_003299 [Parvibaculum indicum]|uniref:alpha/beta hydrolase n=1 Tax=Parvibaculum indicum TaxID=562969 RepID=UPI0014209116|nr:alpha/beta hydrolase-fold protein [Parvibaculum indicum]NIJ42991.1 hypothetical protein [Parvibaculum indicum]
MRIRAAVGFLVLMAVSWGAAQHSAQAEPAGQDRAGAAHPVAIPHSRDISFHGKTGGRDIRLLVWVPPGDAPKNGYPVLYALDGGQLFGMFSDFAQSAAARARMTGRDPALIVAITYPEGEFSFDRRIRDLTPPSDRDGYVMPARPNGLPWPELGGADAWLDMIENDIKPFVAAHFPVDETRETLWGHSFGGMTVLHAAFARPGAFDAYVAVSPSLWFNDGQLMREAKRFLGTPASGKPVPLLMMAGGAEQSLDDWEKRSEHADRFRAWKENNRMIGNARDLAALIEEKGAARIALTFEIVPGLDHGSIRGAAVPRGIDFAGERR